MLTSIQTFGKNFLRCGLVGWCMEIFYTAMNSLRRRDYKLTGITSLWMFPIYGCAALIAPISRLLKKRPLWLRGLTYMSMIFSGEFLSGYLLQKHSMCPWDYYKSRFHIGRVIRLDYAPLWFITGLLFERLLSPQKALSSNALPKN
ncbi:MAG: hypothetical protein IJ833_10640 [Lachnospiraceae bacterium]|nr:hypothetical protein [Lachnospiraceae bacterium]